MPGGARDRGPGAATRARARPMGSESIRKGTEGCPIGELLVFLGVLGLLGLLAFLPWLAWIARLAWIAWLT